MIAVWPLGMTFCLALLLWTHRRRLNPTIVNEDQKEDVSSDLVKLRIRDADESVKFLSFLYEDFRPSYYLFPVFEIVRRVALTSVLAVCYPGTSQQVYVGLLGSMLSYLVFTSSKAFIDHDDNVLADVASAELVLVYFSALAVYVADVADDGSSQAAFASSAFGVFLVFVYFMTFGIAVAIILLDLFGYTTLRPPEASRQLLLPPSDGSDDAALDESPPPPPQSTATRRSSEVELV